jgi:hypothetical protein
MCLIKLTQIWNDVQNHANVHIRGDSHIDFELHFSFESGFIELIQQAPANIENDGTQVT